MYSSRCSSSLNEEGFPIRTPSDQRSVDSSPKTFAATHVLHRLQAPRHSPYALSSLLSLNLSILVVSHETRNWRARPRPPLFAADPNRLARAPTASGQLSINQTMHETISTKYCSGFRTTADSMFQFTLRMQFSKSESLVQRQSRVEPIGIEPTTSSLQSWRSPS